MKNLFRWLRLTGLALVAATVSSCGEVAFRPVELTKDIYFLVDVSKSYTTYSERSLVRLRSVLFSLKPGDRVSIAKIQSCSYSDESVLLPTRSISTQETVANREIKQLGVDIKKLEGKLTATSYTDIRGALIMASQHFKRSRTMHRVLVVFSDLRDDPEPGCATQQDSLIELDGAIIVFADISISKPDEANAAGRMERINRWRDLVMARGAKKVEMVQGVFEIQAILDELSNDMGK